MNAPNINCQNRKGPKTSPTPVLKTGSAPIIVIFGAEMPDLVGHDGDYSFFAEMIM